MNEDKILNGKIVAQKIKDDAKIEIEKLKTKDIVPKLAVIMVGEDTGSKVYVRNKSKACDYVGAEFEEFLLPDTTTEEELLNLIDNLNEDKTVNGILVQSPLPKLLDENNAFKRIDPMKDVDGFNPVNVGNLCIGNDGFVSCTASGIMKILEYYKIDVEGKNAVVIGRSNIVGKPMAQCLLRSNATVTICHSRTKKLKEITSNADILVVAIGKENFVKKDMVKDGAIVIDVGMNRNKDGKLCGDVDFDDVIDKASKITPVPGGVGPMTVAMLTHNLVKATKLQYNIK